MLEAVDQLVAVLKERGSERAVDMDDAAQRVSMEVCPHTDIHPPVPTAGTRELAVLCCPSSQNLLASA